MRTTILDGLLVAVLVGGCATVDPVVTPGTTSTPRSIAPRAFLPTPIGDRSIEVTIFAAASLQDPLDQAEAVIETTSAGWVLRITTDSSAALATQIEQGAPADVFLSADVTNAQRLVDGGLTDGQPVAFAGNELTIVVPPDNPAGIGSWQDLADERVNVIAAGEAVPITRYATQLIDNLARLPDSPEGFAEAYAANIVSREENVKAVISKIELGEGDAGIVYVTDAAASNGVATIPVPAAANVRASYSGVVLKGSRDTLAARAFLNWLAGRPGQAILARYGFLPPPA